MHGSTMANRAVPVTLLFVVRASERFAAPVTGASHWLMGLVKGG